MRPRIFLWIILSSAVAQDMEEGEKETNKTDVRGERLVLKFYQSVVTQFIIPDCQTSPPIVPKAPLQAPLLCLLWWRWRTAPSAPAGSPTCPWSPPLPLWSSSVPGTSPSLSRPGTSTTQHHHHVLHDLHGETPRDVHSGELHLRDHQALPPRGHRQRRPGPAGPEEHLQARPGLLSPPAGHQH